MAVADVTIKRHDTWPPLTATLAEGGAALDLTTATTVEAILRGTKFPNNIVGGLCTFVNRALGQVQYQWDATDTSVSDTYQLEFEITWSDGNTQTVPNDSYRTVVVLDDLENA